MTAIAAIKRAMLQARKDRKTIEEQIIEELDLTPERAHKLGLTPGGTMTTTETTDSVLVYAWNWDDPPKSKVFEQMLKLANEVRHHSGDLFYDAIWLHENMKPEGLTFLFGVRETGTTILDPAEVTPFIAAENNLHTISTWRDEDERWWIKVTPY